MKRIALSLLVALVVTGCSVRHVDESHVGVNYTDGPFEGRKFEKVVGPGGSVTVFNDKLYTLPARQVSYIVSDQVDVGDRPGEDFLTVTTRDRTTLKITGEARFYLNTRADALKPFFTQVCAKYECWKSAKDTKKGGWEGMLQENFREPMNTVAASIGFNYDGSALRYSSEQWAAFSADFAKRLQEEQRRVLGTDQFFCGIDYVRDSKATGCSDIGFSLTSVKFADPALEDIPNQRKAAIEQESLAKQQQATAVAQAQRDVAAAEARRAAATPENLALMRAEAMKACASNPQCTLVITDGGSTVAVAPG